eukprot:scaffold118011_cov75-Phaeocystis_antarctica.AAC.2
MGRRRTGTAQPGHAADMRQRSCWQQRRVPNAPTTGPSRQAAASPRASGTKASGRRRRRP